MSATLSNGVDTFEAHMRLLDGYRSDHESQNIEHVHLDGSMGHSLRPDAPRAGVVPLFFTDAATAHACRAALARPAVWTYTDPVDEVSMSFVRHQVLGAVQQTARARWVLEVGYREVLT